MNVTQLINDKGNAVKNQFIIKGLGSITFQSYNSKICEYSHKLVLQGQMWDYSNTTRKHFKTFINDFTPFNYENKAQWLKEIKNNDLIEVV